jgi:hypothetical protein
VANHGGYPEAPPASTVWATLLPSPAYGVVRRSQSGRPLLGHGAAATVGTYLVLVLVACGDGNVIRAHGIPHCAPNEVVVPSLTSRDNRRRLSAAQFAVSW